MKIQMKSMTLLRVMHDSGNTTWSSQCILLGSHFTTQVQLNGLGHTVSIGPLFLGLSLKIYHTTSPGDTKQSESWLMYTTQFRSLQIALATAWVPNIWCSTDVLPE